MKKGFATDINITYIIIVYFYYTCLFGETQQTEMSKLVCGSVLTTPWLQLLIGTLVSNLS